MRLRSASQQPAHALIGETDFQEYSIWPPPPERRHFLSYLQVVQRPAAIPPTVYTGTLGLAGKSAFSAYDVFAKERTKTVSRVNISKLCCGLLMIKRVHRPRRCSSAAPPDVWGRACLDASHGCPLTADVLLDRA